MKRTAWLRVGGSVVGTVILTLLFYQIPAIHQRLSWRIDAAMAYIGGVLHPADQIPTPLPLPTLAGLVTVAPSATASPTLTTTPTMLPGTPTSTPVPTATPLPPIVALTPPKWEKQDWNNCGPATLAMNLRYWGWDGDQYSIAERLKPERADRNVNVEELAYYVRNYAGWLNLQYRVGGDINLLKSLIAEGFPVMIESGVKLDTTYWPNDDQWAAHYVLLTGYDDTEQVFDAHDTYFGANQRVPYYDLIKNWQTFNYVYLIVYPVSEEGRVQALLGAHWDETMNREYALAVAQRETETDPQNAFAWFNLGSNLAYFSRYREAATAYDQARRIGLPQRMYRYQFGPFIAYFHSGRNDELLSLTEYALQRTPNSEEALLWNGWGLYRDGKTWQAVQQFQAALQANRFYADAQYALDFVSQNP